MIEAIAMNKHVGSYEDNFQSTVATEAITSATAFSDSSNDDLKKKLMEKDKSIIEYIKVIKEQEKKLHTLTKANESLEERNSSLMNEVNSLSIDFKHKESTVNSQKEDIKAIQMKSEAVIAQLGKDNSKLLKTIEDLNNKAKLNEDLIRRWTEENNKLVLTIKSKDQQLEDNKSFNEKNESIIQHLKIEIKQLLSLKRQLNEYEEISSDNKKQLNAIQVEYDRIFKEKERIESELQHEKQRKCLNLVKAKNDCIDYDYHMIQKENKALTEAKEQLTNKYKSIQNDYDSFVNTIIGQIGRMTNDIETDVIMSYPSRKVPMRNETVGDLIEKSLALLQQTITSKQQGYKQQVDSLVHSNKELESINCELLKEKSALTKTNALLSTQNSKYSSESNEKSNQLNDVSMGYVNLKEDYVSLKQAYHKLTQEIEVVGKQTQSFLNVLIGKLSEREGSKSHLSLSDRINEGIDFLIESNKKLSNDLKAIETSSVVLSKECYEKLLKENTDLASQINDGHREMDNTVSQLKLTEEDLLSRVKQLNYKLEDSNQLAISYEAQFKDMKERNRKLENNLDMLTKSHYQLEKALGSNESHLKEELTNLQTQHTSLLLEIELKDKHIQSLEKLHQSELKQSTTPFIGKLMTRGIKGQVQNTPKPQENEFAPNSNSVFIRNEQSERELEKLLIQTISTQENKQTKNSDAHTLNIGKLQSTKPKQRPFS